jgi:DNA-binding NarL/FixJ family response regulator
MSAKRSVSNPSQQVTLLVADDAAVIRKTLRHFLEEEPAIKLLGEARNFAEAISMTAALKPDVILLDLHMPDDCLFKPAFVKANLSKANRRFEVLLNVLVQLGRWTKQSCLTN